MSTMQVFIFKEDDYSSCLGIGIYDREQKTVTLKEVHTDNPEWVDLKIDLVRGDRWIAGGKVKNKEGDVLHLE